MPTKRAASEMAPLVTSGRDRFFAAVVAGLSSPQKSLPSQYFYDARGSELFEDISRLPEYYPTRCETEILRAHAADMVGGAGRGGVLVELGSGSSTKTELLLEARPDLAAYVCVDVSTSALEGAVLRLKARFPTLDIRPLVGDFGAPIAFPADVSERNRILFFPGSTIGNFTPVHAVQLLSSLHAGLTTGGRLLIGVDLKKATETLLRAYDDSAGVTAAFNLNILARINRELRGTFNLDLFRHEARYNGTEGRVEMHLLSETNQIVHIDGRRFTFRLGETIHTENSYKYTVTGFQSLARAAGWFPNRVWKDASGLFSVHCLEMTP